MSQWGHCEEVHTEWNQLLGQIICISALACHGWVWAYQESVLSLCLFFTNVGFSCKTGHYACVSLNHASHEPTLRHSQIEWGLIRGQETSPGWRCQLAWHCAKVNQTSLTGSQHCAWIITGWQDDKTLSTCLKAVKSIGKSTSDNPSTKKEVKANVIALICNPLLAWAA